MVIRLHKAQGYYGLLALLPIGLILAWSARQPAQGIPLDAVSSQNGWADETSCIDCHEQAEAFGLTGHAQTLRPATDPMSIELLKKVSDHDSLANQGTQVAFENGRVVATSNNGSLKSQVQLEWCFGSGHHACTWTSTLPDSAGATDQLEFRWSWYQGDVIDVTPGQPQQPGTGHFGKLGVLFDGPKAYRCFSCHASYLPAAGGLIDESKLIPGIGCQRCHGPRQAHVESDGDYSDPMWQAADRMDAVNRCAECHRRADELTAGEVRTDNVSIVRFQPVGLVQSKCFTHSEMTCTTCHDPHLPASEQDTQGIAQCVQCHNPGDDSHVLCGAGEIEDCLRCHMPAVKMDAPVRFTDHWIRIRDAEEAP